MTNDEIIKRLASELYASYEVEIQSPLAWLEEVKEQVYAIVNYQYKQELLKELLLN